MIKLNLAAAYIMPVRVHHQSNLAPQHSEAIERLRVGAMEYSKTQWHENRSITQRNVVLVRNELSPHNLPRLPSKRP